MVSLEVVNVLAENQRPQVLTQELDHIQRIVKPRPIFREPITTRQLHGHTHVPSLEVLPLNKTLPNTIPRHLKLMPHRIGTLLILPIRPGHGPIVDGRGATAAAAAGGAYSLRRAGCGGGRFVGDAVGERDELDEQEVERRGGEECGVGVGEVVGWEGGFEGHLEGLAMGGLGRGRVVAVVARVECLVSRAQRSFMFG